MQPKRWWHNHSTMQAKKWYLSQHHIIYCQLYFRCARLFAFRCGRWFISFYQINFIIDNPFIWWVIFEIKNVSKQKVSYERSYLTLRREKGPINEYDFRLNLEKLVAASALVLRKNDSHNLLVLVMILYLSMKHKKLLSDKCCHQPWI